MTFFVDANVLLYTGVAGSYREACLEIVASISRGDAGGVSSTAAFEEVWHLELTGRLGSIAGLTERLYPVFAPLLPVTDRVFRRALGVDARKLDAMDRVHAATCLENDIGLIVSAHAGFDGIRGLRRIDPLDDRAVKRLLRG